MDRKWTENGPKMDHNIDHMVYECSLAPIHNPKNLMGINLMEEIFPELPQVAVFDTSFHVKSMPEKAFRYAIPENWYAYHHVRRFGFHGTSHFYVAQEAERILQQKNLKIVSAHLGNGCSICAIKNGQSVDTSMGFSPLEGKTGPNYEIKRCEISISISILLRFDDGKSFWRH